MLYRRDIKAIRAKYRRMKCMTGEPKPGPCPDNSKETAKQRYEYQPRSGSKTPWSGRMPKVGEARIDPDLGTVEVASKVTVSELELSEPLQLHDSREDDIQRYAQWIKDGHAVPPIRCVRLRSGKLRALNNRRVIAARRAGVQHLMAWVDTGLTHDEWQDKHEG